MQAADSHTVEPDYAQTSCAISLPVPVSSTPVTVISTVPTFAGISRLINFPIYSGWGIAVLKGKVLISRVGGTETFPLWGINGKDCASLNSVRIPDITHRDPAYPGIHSPIQGACRPKAAFTVYFKVKHRFIGLHPIRAPQIRFFVGYRGGARQSALLNGRF